MLLTMLALVFCTFLGFSALSFAFFWFETASSPHRAYLDHLFGDKTGRALLWLVLRGAGCLILVAAFTPLAFWRGLWEPHTEPPCPLPPVIFVHGLYHNASAWTLYRRWLKRAGFRNVYAFSYRSWGVSFHDLLAKLNHQVDKVAALHAGKRVILVGHSLGGLLSRAFVECSKNTGSIQAVVTLGSPHQGSKLAALGLGHLAQSLLYGGALIDELEKQAGSTNVPRLAIHSPVDNMVLPNAALRVPHEGWEYYESQPVSHVGMLYHKATAEVVIDYLLRHSTKPHADLHEE